MATSLPPVRLRRLLRADHADHVPACRTDLGGDFAIASTNTGHDATQSLDALWAGNDEQTRIDYGYRGEHAVAVAAKAIQTAYYGTPPRRSYWAGCSTAAAKP